VGVSVGDDRALQAAVLAFKAADRDLRKRINDSTRATFNGPWKSGIAGRCTTRLEQRVLAPGARIAATNPPEFVAASSKRALSGGLVPDTTWPAIEFGVNDRNRMKGNRHTTRQLPSRRPKGPVFNTLADMAHRAPRLWAQLIVKVYSDAADESG
jgi:hypothetical protein